MIDLFSRVINQAVEKTKAYLFPFNFKFWAKMLFIFWLAGAYGGGGLNLSRLSRVFEPKRAGAETSIFGTRTRAQRQAEWERYAGWRDRYAPWAKTETVKTLWEQDRQLVLVVGSAALLLFIVFTLIMLWLAARMSIALIDMLTRGEKQLTPSWRATETLGQSLWLFNCAETFIVILPIIPLAFAIHKIAQAHGFRGFPLTVMLSLFAIAFVAYVAMLVAFTALSFLPVVMRKRNETAWPTFLSMLRWGQNNFWRGVGLVFLYGFTKAVISLAVGMGVGLISFAVMAPVGILGVLGFKSMAVAKIPATILIVLVSILVIVFILAISLIVGVPLSTFFTYMRILLVDEASVTPQAESN